MEPQDAEHRLSYAKPKDVPRQPDARRTVLRAIGVLVMLVIAVAGMLYAGWYILHMPK